MRHLQPLLEGFCTRLRCRGPQSICGARERSPSSGVRTHFTEGGARNPDSVIELRSAEPSIPGSALDFRSAQSSSRDPHYVLRSAEPRMRVRYRNVLLGHHNFPHPQFAEICFRKLRARILRNP